uniref:Putative ovule protein n=1 Tax=Solanum chacoense TaxID=4108 RepID=A0A0V0GQ89_SOLCH
MNCKIHQHFYDSVSIYYFYTLIEHTTLVSATKTLKIPILHVCRVGESLTTYQLVKRLLIRHAAGLEQPQIAKLQQVYQSYQFHQNDLGEPAN